MSTLLLVKEWFTTSNKDFKQSVNFLQSWVYPVIGKFLSQLTGLTCIYKFRKTMSLIRDKTWDQNTPNFSTI